MTADATFSAAGKDLTFPLVEASEGNHGYDISLSLIHISEPTRRLRGSRMPSSA